jgi:CRP-like cAMP-binding protein
LLDQVRPHSRGAEEPEILLNMRDAIFSLVEAAPQFAGLDPKALRTIAARCRPKVFLTGQLVFMEGDPCHDLCILESGRVKFFRMNAKRREQVLKVFERPGDLFCIEADNEVARCKGRE